MGYVHNLFSYIYVEQPIHELQSEIHLKYEGRSLKMQWALKGGGGEATPTPNNVRDVTVSE